MAPVNNACTVDPLIFAIIFIYSIDGGKLIRFVVFYQYLLT